MSNAIVLDKSFLQGTKATRLHELAASHRLLMSDALFYELLSNPEDRANCFAKFPRMNNPVDLVMHVGGLLRIEIDTHKPSGRPSSHIEDIRFQFNKALLGKGYQLPEEARIVVEEQTEELRSDVASFIDRVQVMSTIFPDLLSGSDTQRVAARKEAERVIASDTEAILKFYAQLELPAGHPPLPPVSLVTPEWALFRWLQVQLLFGLDVYRRYNGKIPSKLTSNMYEKFEHDVLDAQCLVLGVIEGSFATHELKLKEWYALIHPEGTLYQ